jgi:hypothetical protein
MSSNRHAVRCTSPSASGAKLGSRLSSCMAEWGIDGVQAVGLVDCCTHQR